MDERRARGERARHDELALDLGLVRSSHDVGLKEALVL